MLSPQPPKAFFITHEKAGSSARQTTDVLEVRVGSGCGQKSTRRDSIFYTWSIFRARQSEVAPSGARYGSFNLARFIAMHSTFGGGGTKGHGTCPRICGGVFAVPHSICQSQRHRYCRRCTAASLVVLTLERHPQFLPFDRSSVLSCSALTNLLSLHPIGYNDSSPTGTAGTLALL
jgi:hypothetical protein